MKNSNDPTSKFHDTGYYVSNEFNIRNPEFLRQEKIEFKREHKSDVSNSNKLEQLKEYYKELKENQIFDNTFVILNKIYGKNQKYAFRCSNTNIEEPLNSDLFNLVTSKPIIRLAYNRLKENKGVTTSAKETSIKEFLVLNKDQHEFLIST